MSLSIVSLSTAAATVFFPADAGFLCDQSALIGEKYKTSFINLNFCVPRVKFMNYLSFLPRMYPGMKITGK